MVNPGIVHTCLIFPLPSLLRMDFVFVFSAENMESQISTKNTLTQLLDGKKTPLVPSSEGAR